MPDGWPQETYQEQVGRVRSGLSDADGTEFTAWESTSRSTDFPGLT